ncbi:MAG: sensor histidine kinase, partial [Actinomycetota bacterium]
NLLSNALKFSSQEAEVTIELEEAEGSAIVRVSDRGIGIPSDEIPKLFERFFRASTAGITEGTGLGLSISKEIVEAHGGSIEVVSEEGAGTTFTISLPLDPND